jgi:hypothetical protein
MSASIYCSHCGTRLEIAAEEVQLELPLGPIEIFPKNKLDLKIRKSVKSNESESSSFNEAKGLTESSPSPSPSRNVARQSRGLFSLDSLNEEEELFESILGIVGEREMTLNERLWRAYGIASREALAYAVRKWNALDPIKRRSIKHPAGWLTYSFKRAEKAFATRKSA